MNLSHFSPSVYRQWVPLVSTTPLTVLHRSFWNFACVFFMVLGYACGLDIIVRSFLSLFLHCELSHFPSSMYRQSVPRVHNSSYNSIPIFMKLYTCFLHSLKMCLCFWYNPCINLCHIFLLCELCRFLTSDVQTVGTLWSQLHIQFYTSLFELCTWFLQGLQMCVWFGYSFWIYFCHFFHFVNFVIFLPQNL